MLKALLEKWSINHALSFGLFSSVAGNGILVGRLALLIEGCNHIHLLLVHPLLVLLLFQTMLVPDLGNLDLPNLGL